MINIIFFGSFQHYSTLILEALTKHPEIKVVGVVTTPPKPSGRDKILTQTDVHQFAQKHQLHIFTPDILENQSLASLPPADHFVVAGYGKLLPVEWLKAPKSGCLNLHFSLLPKFRGANPAEWAIILGEADTGITLITMSPEFDTGAILNQATIPIEATDTRTTLYQKLYALGAQKLPGWLTDYSQTKDLQPQSQPDDSPTPPARRFIKAHGFIDWAILQAAMTGQSFQGNLLSTNLKTAYYWLSRKAGLPVSEHAKFIERAIRALNGYPGVWTYAPTIKGKKRLLVHSAHLKNDRLILDQVQLEGYKPTTLNQMKNQIIQS